MKKIVIAVFTASLVCPASFCKDGIKRTKRAFVQEKKVEAFIKGVGYSSISGGSAVCISLLLWRLKQCLFYSNAKDYWDSMQNSPSFRAEDLEKMKQRDRLAWRDSAYFLLGSLSLAYVNYKFRIPQKAWSSFKQAFA